jgi:hypothetical protein
LEQIDNHFFGGYIRKKPREPKKSSAIAGGTFLFEKTGCLLQTLKEQKGEALRKIAPYSGLISCCNSFATPTRLAAGLGTKEYPFISVDDSPRFSVKNAKFGSPVSLHVMRLR